MRPDLLALTLDDLATLANRGLVKRAQKEVEQFTPELNEDAAGAVRVRWPDDAECMFPAGKTVREATCTCAATTLCRHILRSVLAYQAHTPAPAAAPIAAWNPATITDEALAAHLPPASLTQARQWFNAGQVVELVASRKPTARFYTLPVTVRFLVPHDARYTHCDCAEPAPCAHVPLAVWAFRQLPAEAMSGLVTTQREPLSVPTAALEKVETLLLDWLTLGLGATPPAFLDQCQRVVDACLAAGLLWPAQILTELVHEQARYAAHDARFAPTHFAELVGELGVRLDAIRADTGAVPQLFIRGAGKEQETKVGAARLVGLGCGATVQPGGVVLATYAQDVDSGMVLALQRECPDPDPKSNTAPKPLWQLAQATAVPSVSFAALGNGQLLLKSGKRFANDTFTAARAKVSFNPQAFQWENLRAPLLAEDFAEVRARLAAQPPACLRPRRVTANLFVCAVQRVEGAHFAEPEQAFVATLRDLAGEPATLVHPYFARAHEGGEALLAALAQPTINVRFIAGQVHTRGAALIFNPVGVVLEEAGQRRLLQPWCDRLSQATTAQTVRAVQPQTQPLDPLTAYAPQLLAALGELWVVGLSRSDEATARQWQTLATQGAGLGFTRFTAPAHALAEYLAQKQHTPRWDSIPAARAAVHLNIWARLMAEVG